MDDNVWPQVAAEQQAGIFLYMLIMSLELDLLCVALPHQVLVSCCLALGSQGRLSSQHTASCAGCRAFTAANEAARGDLDSDSEQAAIPQSGTGSVCLQTVAESLLH